MACKVHAFKSIFSNGSIVTLQNESTTTRVKTHSLVETLNSRKKRATLQKPRRCITTHFHFYLWTKRNSNVEWTSNHFFIVWSCRSCFIFEWRDGRRRKKCQFIVGVCGHNASRKTIKYATHWNNTRAKKADNRRRLFFFFVFLSIWNICNDNHGLKDVNYRSQIVRTMHRFRHMCCAEF